MSCIQECESRNSMLTCAVAVRVSVVGLVTGPLIAFTGVSVNISPVARGIYIVTVTLPTHTGP